MPDGIVLSEQDRAKLDGIVQKMISNKESEADIRYVVNDFKNKYGVKKKESSGSTSQKGAVVSPTKTTTTSTSSDTEPPTRAQASVALGGPTKLFGQEEEKRPTSIMYGNEPKKEGFVPPSTPIDTEQSIKYLEKKTKLKIGQKFDVEEHERNRKELERLKAIKKKTPMEEPVEDIYTYQFNSVRDLNNYTSKAKEELDAEINNTGFLNVIKSGLSSTYNAVVSGLGKLADLTPQDISAVQIEKNPIAKEISEVKSDPKNSKLTEEEVNFKAYQLAIENKAKSLRNSQTDDYLKSMPEEVKNNLQFNKVDDLKTIDDNTKKVVKVRDSYLALLENDYIRLNQLKETNQDQNEIANVENRIKSNTEYIKKLEKSIYGLDRKHGSAEEEVDLLKRNYDMLYNISGRVTQTTLNALVTTGDMIADFILPESENNPEYINKLKKSKDELVSETVNDISGLSDTFRKDVKDVNNVNDLINWSSDVFSVQLPNLVAASTGNPGLLVMGATSMAQKRFDMKQEVLNGKAEYNNLQMVAIPLLWGGAEVISEIPTVGILKKAGLSISAINADDVLKRELMNSTFDNFLRTGKGYSKDQFKENAGELFTNVSQNALNKYFLGKDEVGIFDNSEDILKDTFLMTSMLQLSPHILGAVIKPFTAPEYTNVLDNNSKQILNLNKLLGDKNVSEEVKSVAKNKIAALNAESGAIVNNVISSIDKMSDAGKSRIAKIEKEQSKLRAKASEIAEDKTIDVNTKKDLLNTLKAQFKLVEDERVNILSGKTTVEDMSVKAPAVEVKAEEVVKPTEAKAEEVKPSAEISVDEARDKRWAENNDLAMAEGSTFYEDTSLKNAKIGDEFRFTEYKDGEWNTYNTKVKDIVDEKIIFENGKTQDDISSFMNKTAQDAWFAKNHPELTLETKPTDAKAAIESPIELKEGEELVDVKQDKKGNTYTYVAETSEKDGVKTTKFKFNRSDKSSEQRNTAGVDADKVLDKYGYEIPADEIPEGSKVVEINEIREDATRVAATVTFENEDGIRFTGEVKLQPKAKEAKVAEVKPTEAKAEVKPAEALKDVESTAKALEGNLENMPLSFDYDAKNPSEVSEAYHKAKAEGTNPELVKAVEELLAPEVKPAAEVTPTVTEAKVAIPDQHREEYDRLIKEYEKNLADSKENLKSEKERSFFSRSRSYIKENENDIKFYENQIKLLKENPIEFYKNWIKSVEETHNDSLKDKSKYDDGKTYKERIIEGYGTTDFNVVYEGFIEDFNRKIADYEAAQKTANENAKLKKPAEVKDIVAPEAKAEEAKPTETEATATEEIAPSDIDTTLDEVITPASSNIKEQIARAKRAISKFLPNVEIVYHTTAESFQSVVGDNSRGYYDPNTKKIHINGSNANSRTVSHEVFHAVVLKYITSDKQATELTNRMFKALAKSIKNNPKLLEDINKFADNYSKGLQSEEKLAEVLGYLASEYETLPDVSKNIIQKWIEKIAKMVGIKRFTDQEVVDFMNAIATKVAYGQEITEGDVSKVLEGGKKVSSPSQLIRRQKVGSFDVEYTEKDKLDSLIKDGLVTEPENTSFMSNEQVAITSPDDMLVGTISIDGKKIFEGGGGVFFVTKYGDVWASGNEGTANTLAGAINKSLENNKSGKGYLVLTKGSDSKLISSVSGVNSSLSILETMLDKGFISLSDFRKAVSESVKKEVFNISVNDQVKNYKKENKLSKGDKIPDTVMQSIKEKAKKVSESNKGFIKLSSESKQLKTDIETYFSDPSTSTFETRGNVIKDLIGRLSQSKSIKENFKKIIDLLGGDNTKKLGKDKTKTSESLADLIAGVASENLTKGLNVGDVYAIIEVNGEVKVKKDSHPSYPFHVVQKDGKKPILHLPKLRENGSKTITTSSGKPYSVGQVSIMSGTFNDVSGRRQISPENSSNYANMTEDGKGNFVFYHFGPRGIKAIDPKKYGSNKGAITSKPEVAAMGRVGGMSQFYTMPEYQESNVSGDKYMIKVPMDKVYDFNTDPENFYDRAREMFKAKHPDLPFTANDQLAYITKLAEKAGYDMTVAEWNDMSRAQSTKALKPVDTQVMDGNVISKPFQEDYESNSAKGFESVIPTSKEAKLKDVYQKINAERNAKNRYDSLYSLAEDFPKLSQDKITDMIESSDISQEMKDAYAEALAYEPGTRMSGRRQVDAKATAKNTKAEVDRIKALPINAEDGATFNLDGTKYEGGGLVVPMNSLEGNTTQEKISPDMIGDFAKENENSISDESMVKMGIYKFPDLDTVSIDMNIVIPNEHRAVALEFGALTGQKSLFDLDTFEYVETGGDGLNTMKLTPAQFREAASSLKNGVMPTFVSGRKQKSPIDTAVETAKRKGFNDKEIADYLVGKGYTRAQATNAILRYNNVTAAKLRKEDSVFTKEGRNKIITFLDQVKRRALSAKSFLPKSVFKFKEGIEANIKAEAKRASYLVDDFNKLVKGYKGDVNALNDEFDRYLRGDQTAVLPDEFKVVAGKMRMHIDNLSQMLLRTGAVSVSQAETIAANLGQYINRSYQVFDKKNWAKQVKEEMKEAARVDLRNMYMASAEAKAKQTGMDADIILEKFINDKIDELISGESAATFLGIGKTGSKDLSIMKQRLDIPLSIRQLMGEYTDASQNYARTVIKIATLAENARFLQSARDAGMGVFFFKEGDINKPSEFNVQIAGEGSETMNPLNGLFTTKEIADAFKTSISAEKFIEGFVGPNVASSVVSLYTNYMKLLSVVKWNKTIASVATHFKNVTGNIWFMLSNGYFNYKKYGDAFNVLRNSSNEQLRDKLDEYIRAGIIDQSAALGEIKSMFSDADFDTAIENRLKKNPLEKAKKAARWVITKLNTAYQLEDDFYKIVSYESEKDRYSNAEFQKPFDQLTEDQKLMVSDIAAENTKNVLPNYARIPGLVKLIKIAPVTGTFISFQAEAYRTAWNTVALAFDELNSKNKRVKAIGAKRLAGIAFSQSVKFGLMTAIGTVLRGGDDDDEEDKLNKNVREFVPEWSKKSDLALVEYGNGKFSYVDFSASDPHGGIKKAYNSFMAGDGAVESFTNGMSEILGPFVKKDMLLEAITDINNNENSYGGKLYNDADTNVNKINAVAERFYKVLEPGSLTSSRKIAQAENVGNELAGQLTGYKVITIDVGQQLGFKMNKSKDDIREAKRLYNSAFYKFEDGKMTAEELESNYNQANSAQKEMYKSIMDNMKAASFFGVEDKVIDDAMEGIGKGVVNDLWYGEIPDMKQKEKKLTDEEFRAKYGERLFERLLRARELSKKGAR